VTAHPTSPARADRHLEVTRIVVRPIGTPLPLGFLALVVATTGFSALQLGWIPPEQGAAVALGVLALTVPLQLLSSIFGFLARDPVAGTGMGILAGTWGAAATVTFTGPPGASSPALGILFLASAASMLVPAVAGATKLVAAGVMALTSVRFLLTGIAELTGAPAWETAAGATGLVLAAAALYAALAFELEDTRHRTSLPVGRRGSGGDALTGTVDDELADVAHEAGVRKQL
jgi:succinate-acetate transporter protein